MNIKCRDRVLLILSVASRRLSGMELMRVTGYGPGTMYPVLYALEQDRTIESEWIEGPVPRTRVYGLPRKEHNDV